MNNCSFIITLLDILFSKHSTVFLRCIALIRLERIKVEKLPKFILAQPPNILVLFYFVVFHFGIFNTGVNKTKTFPQPKYPNVQFCMDYITIGIVNIYQNNLHF